MHFTHTVTLKSKGLGDMNVESMMRGREWYWLWYSVSGVRQHVSPRSCLEMQDLSFLRVCSVVSDSATPWTVAHRASQARILEWVAISFSRGSSWPRDQTRVSCIGRQIYYHRATWEALQDLRSHPNQLNENLYFNKISRWLVSTSVYFNCYRRPMKKTYPHLWMDFSVAVIL